MTTNDGEVITDLPHNAGAITMAGGGKNMALLLSLLAFLGNGAMNSGPTRQFSEQVSDQLQMNWIIEESLLTKSLKIVILFAIMLHHFYHIFSRL